MVRFPQWFKLLLYFQKLCAEVEAENEEGFDAIVKKNSSIVKLDPWYGAVIGKIRKEIPGELNSLRWIVSNTFLAHHLSHLLS